jgi:hypothetical protein
MMLAMVCCGAVESKAGGSSPSLVQAIVGFNKPNEHGLPCLSPCLGAPSGTVLIQPHHFISSGSKGLYYAVFQGTGWGGNLSASFQLSAKKEIIQQMTVQGALKGQGLTVLSGSTTIPQTNYSGPAILTVTTTATPSDGSPAFTLTSLVGMQIGKVGIRRLVQVLAGVSLTASVIPCVGCVTLPDAVAVQPIAFLPTQGTLYAVFQGVKWAGNVKTTFDLLEGTHVGWSVSTGGIVSGSLAMIKVDPSLAASYSGSAAIRVTTLATPAGHNTGFTLKSYEPVEVQ